MNQDMLNKWIAVCTQKPQRIAFPEATEEKILKAARLAQETGSIIPVYVGAEADIRAAAEAAGVSLEGAELVDSTLDEAKAAIAAKFVANCPQAGLSEKAVIRKSKDPMYFAYAMQAVHDVDSVFAGLVHTTGDVILAASTMLGLKEGITTVSSIGILDIPGWDKGLMAFGDAAVCVDPTPEEHADIAISACETFKALLDIEPRCAMLSFSTDGSAEHPLVDRVREAVRIANEKRPDLKIDGEFQLDAALVPETAAKKVKRPSEVAGNANIFIYPNISAGNIGVKLCQIFAHADAYGPILQGFSQPTSDCSRGAPVSELMGNIIMLAVRCIKG
jgi:phosphate acetyltransferase